MQYIWKDRKRYLGIPMSFTRYAISEDVPVINIAVPGAVEEYAYSL